MHTGAFRILEDEERRLVTVRLSRGDSGNRMLASELPAFGQAIRAQGSRPDVKAVLVSADGPDFCLGRQTDPPGTAATDALGIRTTVTEPILGVYAQVRDTPVPVIAVIQGQAKGFGCAVAAACDLAIAADTARFSLPELDHDLPPTLAMSALLHKITPKRLLDLVYTRRAIGAADALAIGLISEVASAAQLDAAADRLVQRLTDRRRAALVAVKEYMNTAIYADPRAAERLAANILSCVLSSPKSD